MITSNSNDKIKYIAGLIKSSKNRRQNKAFVVEGERIVRDIPHERIKECFVSESFLREKSEVVDGLEREGIRCETVADNVFKKMADTMNPQGILCEVGICEVGINDFIKAHGEGMLKLLILESIQDPGNIGTMIRTAEAAGFDGIICDRGTVDIYNPKVTRSTMGSLFRMPVMYADDFRDVLTMLKETKVSLMAAHLAGESDFHKINYPDRVGILIGNEGNGLTDETSRMADILVKIPMEGKIESLNASVAAALLMYEVRNRLEI